MLCAFTWFTAHLVFTTLKPKLLLSFYRKRNGGLEILTHIYLKKENVSPLMASVISTGAWKYNPSSPRAPVQSLDRGQDGTPKQGATEMPGARKCSPAYLLPSQSFWASSIASSEFVNVRHESTLQNQKNFIYLPCYL